MFHYFLKSLEQFYQKMQSMLFSDIFHNLLNKFYQKNAVNTFCRSAPLLFTMSWIILISQRFLQICSASFYSFIRKKSVPLLLTISWIYFFLNAVNAFLGSVPLLLTISWIFFSEKTRAKQICSATFYNIMNIFFRKCSECFPLICSATLNNILNIL